MLMRSIALKLFKMQRLKFIKGSLILSRPDRLHPKSKDSDDGLIIATCVVRVDFKSIKRGIRMANLHSLSIIVDETEDVKLHLYT